MKSHRRKKVYAYEIFDGDHGVIIAHSYKEACKIFKGKYNINIKDFDTGIAFLREVGVVKNNYLYVTLEF